MSISKIGGTGSDYWELISSVTPTAATAAVNFTGLVPYKKLAVILNGIITNASAQVRLRINNDSGSNYVYSFASSGGNIVYGTNTSIEITPGGSTAHESGIALTSCDNTGLKLIDFAFGESGSSVYSYFNGFYKASAIVTEINVVLSTSTFTAVGNVSLYGVK